MKLERFNGKVVAKHFATIKRGSEHVQPSYLNHSWCLSEMSTNSNFSQTFELGFDLFKTNGVIVKATLMKYGPNYTETTTTIANNFFTGNSSNTTIVKFNNKKAQPSK